MRSRARPSISSSIDDGMEKGCVMRGALSDRNPDLTSMKPQKQQARNGYKSVNQPNSWLRSDINFAICGLLHVVMREAMASTGVVVNARALTTRVI